VTGAGLTSNLAGLLNMVSRSSAVAGQHLHLSLAMPLGSNVFSAVLPLDPKDASEAMSFTA